MKQILDRIFGHPLFFREFISAGKFAALVQLIGALVLCGFSQTGGPFGLTVYAKALLDAGLTTVALIASIDGVAAVFRRYGIRK